MTKDRSRNRNAELDAGLPGSMFGKIVTGAQDNFDAQMTVTGRDKPPVDEDEDQG